MTLAASRQEDAAELDGNRDPFADSVDALTVFIDALGKSPAFSCQASCRPGAPRVPGRRAVAAAIDALQLIAEVLQAVAGMPALLRVHLHGFSLHPASGPVYGGGRHGRQLPPANPARPAGAADQLHCVRASEADAPGPAGPAVRPGGIKRAAQPCCIER